jgi:hypothetical protein
MQKPSQKHKNLALVGCPVGIQEPIFLCLTAPNLKAVAMGVVAAIMLFFIAKQAQTSHKPKGRSR